MVYSTYLGGVVYSRGSAIAVDGSGNSYIVGTTCSFNFPVTPGAFQENFGGSSGCEIGDAFVTKLSSTGSTLVYSSYLGGSGGDSANGIAVDNGGNAYVTGATSSSDFPTTLGAFQTVCNGGSGCSNSGDGFVSKVNLSGSALVYSTYLGGSGFDGASSIAVDSEGNAYVTGSTFSSDFPTMNPLQATIRGSYTAFVTKINALGSALIYSTYLGGSGGDSGAGMAVDGSGNSYVVGNTGSPDFPTTPGAFQTICNGGGQCNVSSGDAFVSKISPDGSLFVWSTYLGGSSAEQASGVAIDSQGYVYVAGFTSSYNFPLVSPSQKKFAGGGWDAFVTRFSPSGTALFSSTYLGGGELDLGYAIAADSVGDAYVTGLTQSSSFPTTHGALQVTCGGTGFSCRYDGDAFLTKIQMTAVTTSSISSSLNPIAYGQQTMFNGIVSSGKNVPPDGEQLSFRVGSKALGFGVLTGGSASFTISTLKVGTTAVTAVYTGDSNFVGSTSKPLKQVVTKATTTTALSSSQNPSHSGQSVTFTATVTPQFSGTPTGTVSFYDGATLLKSVALSAATAKYTTTKLTSGSHTITATYNGSTSFTGSTTSLTQTVN